MHIACVSIRCYISFGILRYQAMYLGCHINYCTIDSVIILCLFMMQREAEAVLCGSGSYRYLKCLE